MNARVLFVDDDANILEAFKRQLFKDFKVDTALGPEEGLTAVDSRGPYAVVVADMRMPGMDGIQFLGRVKDMAPDTIRMMLTGHSDLRTAIDAINEGNIFRFLTKPCPPHVLSKTLKTGVEQYRLVMAEKELLEKTLRGSIKVLTDVLSIVSPTAFGRASRVRRLVQDISGTLKVDKAWQVEVAAMLSQIGCVTVPEYILTKVYSGEVLAPEEASMFEEHLKVGRDLVGNIPRLEAVAESIAYQEKLFNGSGIPRDSKYQEQIPLGARILKVALDFDTLLSAGKSNSEGCAIMETRTGWYDPAVLGALTQVLDLEQVEHIGFLKVDDLAANMILADDVKTTSGVLLVSEGQEVTPSLRMRLSNYKRTRGIREPIKVIIPSTNATDYVEALE